MFRHTHICPHQDVRIRVHTYVCIHMYIHVYTHILIVAYLHAHPHISRHTHTHKDCSCCSIAHKRQRCSGAIAFTTKINATLRSHYHDPFALLLCDEHLTFPIYGYMLAPVIGWNFLDENSVGIKHSHIRVGVRDNKQETVRV
jgi:hypothetical protein